MAKAVSEEEIAVYRELFDSYDEDRDGVITVVELETLLDTLGQHDRKSYLIKLIKDMEQKDTERVNFSTFVECLSGGLEMDQKEYEMMMREAFKVFDKDGKGHIKTDKLKSAFKSLGKQMSKEEVDEIMREIDFNQDGTIDYEDITRAMNSH